ncbi:hypothetical protein FB451DRAFT_1163928 [Mycena latifolia]|nr:hypothetical protein FB451DRAFT_1163928 [Mycena latifolia]
MRRLSPARWFGLSLVLRHVVHAHLTPPLWSFQIRVHPLRTRMYPACVLHASRFSMYGTETDRLGAEGAGQVRVRASMTVARVQAGLETCAACSGILCVTWVTGMRQKRSRRARAFPRDGARVQHGRAGSRYAGRLEEGEEEEGGAMLRCRVPLGCTRKGGYWQAQWLPCADPEDEAQCAGRRQ